MIAEFPDRDPNWLASPSEVLLAALKQFPQPLGIVPQCVSTGDMSVLLDLRLLVVDEWTQTAPTYKEPGAVSLTPMGLRMAKYLSDPDSEVTK